MVTHRCGHAASLTVSRMHRRLFRTLHRCASREIVGSKLVTSSEATGSLWVRAQINEDSAEQVLQVEQRYNAVRRPVYDKRAQMIA